MHLLDMKRVSPFFKSCYLHSGVFVGDPEGCLLFAAAVMVSVKDKRKKSMG